MKRISWRVKWPVLSLGILAPGGGQGELGGYTGSQPAENEWLAL